MFAFLTIVWHSNLSVEAVVLFRIYVYSFKSSLVFILWLLVNSSYKYIILCIHVYIKIFEIYLSTILPSQTHSQNVLNTSKNSFSRSVSKNISKWTRTLSSKGCHIKYVNVLTCAIKSDSINSLNGIIVCASKWFWKKNQKESKSELWH